MKLSRRQFHVMSGAAGLSALTSGPLAARDGEARWYNKVKRWAQINMTADDAAAFDLSFWRDYWKVTRSQGVMLSAGGQLAFYPTKLADQPRASGLGDRDLFGDLAKAARDDGLVVLARLSLRGSPELVRKYPDWANVDASGKKLATPCMNGGYYWTYGADIVREIAHRYRPSGFTLSGWGPNYSLCYCGTCSSLFLKDTGQSLPREKKWEDPLYRRWVEWNNDRVVALWDHSNQVAREAGGPDCLWVGQLVGSMLTRNLKQLSDRTPLMMIDHQSAENESGPVDNSVFGKTLNGLRDWQRPATVATALYAPRLNSPTREEITMWMAEGIAGGARPWWNIIGGYTEDKRRFAILPELMQWHERNERYLVDRRPAANVGLVWSDTNNLWFGREDLVQQVRLPWQGMVNALTRARIPFTVVHADDIDRDAAGLAGLVLPNLGAMTDKQIEAIRRFAAGGGGVLATGETSLYDSYGSPRPDYGLADLFGTSLAGTRPFPPEKGLTEEQLLRGQLGQIQGAGAYIPTELAASSRSLQSFLRLTPELRHNAYGPKRADEPSPAVGAARHPALRGFDATDLIYFGGRLHPLRVAPDAQTLLTFVPEIKDTQPENAVFTDRYTDLPGLVVRENPHGGRAAFLPADLDRRYAQRNLPDHAELMANLTRWITHDSIPLRVEASGLFDFNLYRQPGRLILHIANLNNSATWRKPIDEFVPSGIVDLQVRLPTDMKLAASAKLLVADRSLPVSFENGWAALRVPSVLSHEVVVIDQTEWP